MAALRDEESNRVEKEVAVAAEAVGVGGREAGGVMADAAARSRERRGE